MDNSLITTVQLKRIIGNKYGAAELEQIADTLNQTFHRYAIKTQEQVCHFLAQVLHESGCFQYRFEIWGNTKAQQGYDTRVDLGNTPEKDGDGYTYRGRGWIQTTGKANYRKAAKEFGIDVVKDPDLLAQYPYVGLSAGFFWDSNKFNALLEKCLKIAVPKGHTQDEVVLPYITKKVNGGFNGLEDRMRWLTRCKDVLIRNKK